MVSVKKSTAITVCTWILVLGFYGLCFAAGENPLAPATSKLKEAVEWLTGDFAKALVAIVLGVFFIMGILGKFDKGWAAKICIGCSGLLAIQFIVDWMFAK